MGLARQAYNTLFRRSSTFLLTIVVGAVLFERVFDEGLDRVWERNNEGVCKQTFIIHKHHCFSNQDAQIWRHHDRNMVHPYCEFFIVIQNLLYRQSRIYLASS